MKLNMKLVTGVLICFAGGIMASGARSTTPAHVVPEPVSLQEIQVQGELGLRISRNFDRLEEPYYQPDQDFPDLKQSGNWPGDKEGRVLLGLTLDGEAAHRVPKYLAEILRRYPEKFNGKGYFGDICPAGVADEQQLAGHGWVLRGLCEYFLWTHDPQCLKWINRILDNLVLPTGKLQAEYPIDSTRRVAGGDVNGTISRKIGSWLVSTDVGCDFIFLDGLVQAYQITERAELKPIIDSMAHRFQEMDLRTVQAQTHASLTGMRALLRYYEITRQPQILSAVIKRFNLYRHFAMTENFENYNWFGRPEWTEPCAVIDSYMVAMSLWRWTGDADYAALSEHIYYNGICFEQRANGGFGIQKCSRADSPMLTVDCQEASWCCTMRGGEGLARVAQSLCFQLPGGLDFVHFNDASIRADFKTRGILELTEQTTYPFGSTIRFTVLTNSLSFTPTLRLFAPPWTAIPNVRLNGQRIKSSLKDHFVTVQAALHPSDVIEYSFTLLSGRLPVESQPPTANFSKLYFGPLLLGCPLAHNPVLPPLCRISSEAGHHFPL